MRFYLHLDNREHIGTEHFGFGMINWLPTDQRIKQCLSTSVFESFSEMCPQYMNEIYKTPNQNNIVTRNSSSKLFQSLRTKTLTQKFLSYLRPLIWNGLLDDVKLSNNENKFKHKVKKRKLRKKIKISMYTKGKLPPSLSNFNYANVIRTGK